MTWAFRPWTPAEQAQLRAGSHIVEYDYRKGIAGLTVRVRPCSDFPPAAGSASWCALRTDRGPNVLSPKELRRLARASQGSPEASVAPISVAEARRRGLIK